MDYIGKIVVPEIPVTGIFPVKPDLGWGQAWQPDVAIHQFGSGDAKIEPAAAGSCSGPAPRSSPSARRSWVAEGRYSSADLTRDILNPGKKAFWRRLLELMIPRPTVRLGR